MAFTEEQEASILEALGKVGAMSEKLEAFNAKKEEPKNEPKDDDKDGEAKDETKNIIDQVKKDKADSKEEQNSEKHLEDALKFNLGADKFYDDNKRILPEITKDIIEKINKKDYSNAVEKANHLRSNIMTAFFELDENRKDLPSDLEVKAKAFMALAEDEKVKRSGEYVEVLNLCLDRKRLILKAEDVSKANGYVDNEEQDPITSQIFEKGSKLLNRDKDK